MKRNGFFGIGCLGMKTSDNYGTLFRTAQAFDADFIFLIGARFKRQATDTAHSSRHIPLYVYSDFADFNSHRPHGGQLIGIELTTAATPLQVFQHPRQAVYLLGGEDCGLSNEAIGHCQAIVRIPGNMSLNVATAGSIVLYDRIAKLEATQ
jgi:tRNA G18 (ribose-2'-O)-methylase SpoU